MKRLFFHILLFKKFLYLFIYPIIQNFKSMRPIRLGMENYLIFQPAKLRAVRVKKNLLKAFIPQRFTTSDGARLYAWYVSPKEGKPTILHLHGQAESILSNQDVVEFAIKHGYGCYMLSYRGHYRSWGLPSEKGIYLDAQTALAQIENLGIKHEDVILWGHSLGTTVAVETAKKNNVKALILQAPIKNIKTGASDIIKFYFKKMHLHWIRRLAHKLINQSRFIQKFDNVAKISKITCPILVMHSKQDKIAPYYNSIALKNENENIELFISNKGTHWNTDWCFAKALEFISNL